MLKRQLTDSLGIVTPGRSKILLTFAHFFNTAFAHEKKIWMHVLAIWAMSGYDKSFRATYIGCKSHEAHDLDIFFLRDKSADLFNRVGWNRIVSKKKWKERKSDEVGEDGASLGPDKSCGGGGLQALKPLFVLHFLRLMQCIYQVFKDWKNISKVFM